MSDDDQSWLDTLAGRTAADATRADVAEARVLRDLIRAQLQEGTVAAAGINAAREAALIERARAEGLLPARGSCTPSRAGAPRRHARNVWWLAGGGLIAATLLASVILGLLRNEGSPTQTFRGMDGSAVRIESTNPQALKDQLLRELNDAGVHATGYDRLGRLGVDADLPQPLPAALQDLLQRHHIPIPPDGALTVEIETASRP